MTSGLAWCTQDTVEAMQATIDEETAAQLNRDRAQYGVARMVVRADGRIERVPPVEMRVEVETARERHGDGL